MITTQQLQEDFTSGLNTFLSNYPDSALFEPIRYLLSLGGKRIRPILALAVCNSEGSSSEKAIPDFVFNNEFKTSFLLLPIHETIPIPVITTLLMI